MDLLEKKTDLDLFDNETTIHIRVISRGGKKKLTLIEGIDELLEKESLTQETMKVMIKHFKKKLMCSVAYTTNKKTNGKQVIQLQGNHTDFVKQYIIDNKIIDASKIETHG